MRCVSAGIFVLLTRVDGGCVGMGWSVLAAWLRRMTVVGLSRGSTDSVDARRGRWWLLSGLGSPNAWRHESWWYLPMSSMSEERWWAGVDVWVCFQNNNFFFLKRGWYEMRWCSPDSKFETGLDRSRTRDAGRWSGRVMLVCQFVSLSIWQRSLGLGIWDGNLVSWTGSVSGCHPILQRLPSQGTEVGEGATHLIRIGGK